MAGKQLGHALVWAAAGVLIIGLVLAEIWKVQSAGDETLALLVGCVMLLSTTLIASGHHVRKYLPGSSTPRTMAGVGGVVLIVGFLLPVFDGEPLVGQLFADGFWEHFAGVAVCILAVLGYGITATFSFAQGPKPSLTMTLSILARCIMIGVPLVILLTSQTKQRGGDFGIQFILLLKQYLAIYGLLALTATGLAAITGPQPELEEQPARQPRRRR